MSLLAQDPVDLARAWLDTILAVSAQPQSKALHVITPINSVESDGEVRIHRAAGDLLEQLGLPPVSTVANTIFPQAMAQQTPDIAELTDRYLKVLPDLKRLDSHNRRGTYFSRLIAYPAASGPVNQIERVITNLRTELASDAPMSARYETSLQVPDGQHPDSPATQDVAAPVQDPGRDNHPRGFPCLSFLSFQHDKTHLHAVAHYRYQYLMQRGLGNYLGIARLMRYIAGHTGLQPGALTVIAGRAAADRLTKVQTAALSALREDLVQRASTSGTDTPTAAVR